MIALIAIAVLATALAARSEVAQSGETGQRPVLNVVPEAAIHRAVEAFVRQRIVGQVDPEDRIVVSTRWQGAVLLDRAGQVTCRVVPLSSRPFRGPVVVRVELMVRGETAKTLTLTVDTRIHRPVLVSATTLRRGTPITGEMVELVERDITNLKAGFYTDVAELEGWRTRRPIGYGTILTGRHVEPIPVVNRGDEIILVTESANMQLSVRGVAMQDGGVGCRIRVKNADSGKVLSGRIVDRNTIRIGL